MGGCAAGNEAFKAKEYKKAIGHYMQAGSPPPPGTSPHAPRSLAESAAEPAHGGDARRRRSGSSSQGRRLATRVAAVAAARLTWGC